MTNRDLTQIRDTVGISLIGSEETTAAIALVRETMPGVTVTDNDVYYKVEGEGKLVFDMVELGDRIGRDYTVHDFLVNMTSYYGRIVINDGVVEIHSEILPERFRD
jgi:propane monooxygenase coupling protein